MIPVIEGDLLDAKDIYIAHQTNCVSTNARGIAKQIFDKYPNANTYKNHNMKRSIPGTIEVIDPVINMYGQYYPTVSKYSNDTNAARIVWFTQCLEKIKSVLPKGSIVGMPYLIGCGLAGGSWPIYLKLLEEFVKSSDIKIILYKLT